MNEIALDARGLLCPLPVLKLRKILQTAAPPVRVIVQVTDPATEKDFRLFCEDSGYRWAGQRPCTDGAEFIIENND